MSPGWVNDENAALLTDLYQLTMLQAYHREGLNGVAVFDMFVRRLRERNYLIACGLDTVLHYLETLRFSQEAIDYLSTLPQFKPEFLEWLSGFRFEGDVYAIPEGTPVFADEPIIQVVAPLPQAQLVETFILNQITYQTGIASKTSRVIYAAEGRLVVDFGLRRMQGTDAGMKSVRAGYIAGIEATSNVLAAQVYGLPPSGTMAHSYVEVHDLEEDAFVAFSELYAGTTLLVDTYDTLQAVRRTVALRKALGERFDVGAIRLDSGDMAELAKGARAILDEGGMEHVKIFASGSLDEFEIATMLARGAPIDAFGVGTKLGTLADRPYLDSAYKLAEYDGQARMKLSQHKSNLPGRKQINRFYEQGRMVRDVITAFDEPSDGTPLLECVMKSGRRTEAGKVTLDQARAHAREALSQLPDHLMTLDETDRPYPVEVSRRLHEISERLEGELEEKAGRIVQASDIA